MKQTPLQRRTPLRQGKPLSRGSGRSGKALKRTAPRRVEGYDYERFCQGIADRDGADCWVRRNVSLPPEALSCDGQLDGHHVLPKQWLKSEFSRLRVIPTRDVLGAATLSDWLNDPRNGILVCRRHHDLLENARIAIDPESLPPCVVEFAAELGERALARLQQLTNQRYEPTPEGEL